MNIIDKLMQHACRDAYVKGFALGFGVTILLVILGAVVG